MAIAPQPASVAFPRLTPEDIALLDGLGERRTFDDGVALFREGETGFPFYVIVRGRMSVVEGSSGEEREVVVHEAGEFSGDVDLLSGRPAVVSGLAVGETEVLAIPVERLRQVVKRCPNVGDRVMQAFLERRRLLVESGFVGVRVLGSRFSADTLRIREFLAKNGQPYTWTDLETDAEAQTLLERFGITPAQTPVVRCEGRSMLHNPTNAELADCLGIRRPVEDTTFDLVVVGAGPAGLAAAVYGASEGLKTLVLDKTGPGGQAGTSSKIENYMGFPMGLSGSELAERAVLQARKFGAELSVPAEVVGLECGFGHHILRLADGSSIRARAVLIASGASYRKLPATNAQKYEGSGLFYACTAVEAQLCSETHAFVVGGGNSAGQAAVFLSGRTKGVSVVIRGGDLGKSMSEYLATRIESSPSIEVLKETEIRGLEGNGRLERVRSRNKRTGEETATDSGAVFVFIGADPHTHWLPYCVAVDSKGFVLTGPEAKSGDWHLDRDPGPLETSVPGVFAAGDVRAASVKRVASAVGEGSMTVHLVHRYLSGR